MTPLSTLGEVSASVETAWRRSDTTGRVAEGAHLVNRVTETTAALVLNAHHTRVDVGSSEGAVVGAGVVVVGKCVSSDASLEGVELVRGLAVGGVVDNVLFGRSELVAGLLADKGGRGLTSATSLVGGLGELGAEDGLLPLNGDILGVSGVARKTILDLVRKVAGLPVQCGTILQWRRKDIELDTVMQRGWY